VAGKQSGAARRCYYLCLAIENRRLRWHQITWLRAGGGDVADVTGVESGVKRGEGGGAGETGDGAYCAELSALGAANLL